MNHGIKKTLMALAALAAVAPLAWGFANNLYVGAVGDQVIGFDGLPIPDGSRIEFRKMYKAGPVWTAYAPEADLVDTRNPLLAESAVGAGVIPSARGRGKFAACVCGLDTNNAYVVRLFSGPTPGESVAYCDSRPFTYADDDTRTVTNVTFGVWKALDGSPLEDTDGDGLVDVAETTLSATDPDNWDTDGDGFSDGFEHTHGMDPRAPYFLDIRLAATPVPEDLLADDEGPVYLYDVAWPSISGLTYNLEYVADMLAEDEDWVGITNVTAIDTNTVVPVDDWHLDHPRGFFRVWTVLPTNGAPAGE
ncbi:MAG: hypothetical protein IKQ15_09875 [Kiritimatiellae bacterium]|nr:hypothetical protein [Kiritimatiellia bacterium]